MIRNTIYNYRHFPYSEGTEKESLVYICICHAVTDRDVRACIEEGACTMRELRAALRVGTQCGKCGCYVREILKEQSGAESTGLDAVSPA
jgi:bacterioferritin-associated ferredoxin